jgi:hypothetical protein
MDTTTATPSEYGWPMKCENVGELLTAVTAQINDYEAKQLGKLKSELEAFDKKKQAVADAYKAGYEGLRCKWRALTAEIETQRRRLICLFGDEWKTYVTECICKNLSEIAKAEEALQARNNCSLGPLELKLKQAKAATDEAKIYLDTLVDNLAALGKELAKNEAWIRDIKSLIDKPDTAAKAIHILWFKVLPLQWRMASDDLRKCLKFAEGESPCELCPPKLPLPEQDCAKVPHPVPWLVDPKCYAHELDCAWTAYRNAKDKQGEAEVAYNKAPDNVATAAKQLDELKKDLDARIAKCLESKKPKNCGCNEPPKPAPCAEKSAEQTADAVSKPATNQEI